MGQKPRFWQRKNPENQWFSGFFGGDKRDRTADLLNAIQALSRLDGYPPAFMQAHRLYPHFFFTYIAFLFCHLYIPFTSIVGAVLCGSH